MDTGESINEKLKELRKGNLTLMGRNHTDHILKKLTPIIEKGSKDEHNTYLFQSDYSYRIGYDNNSVFFLDPTGGPLMSKGEIVPIIFKVDGQKVVDTIKIKDITYADNMGYIVTIE